LHVEGHARWALGPPARECEHERAFHSLRRWIANAPKDHVHGQRCFPEASGDHGREAKVSHIQGDGGVANLHPRERKKNMSLDLHPVKCAKRVGPRIRPDCPREANIPACQPKMEPISGRVVVTLGLARVEAPSAELACWSETELAGAEAPGGDYRAVPHGGGWNGEGIQSGLLRCLCPQSFAGTNRTTVGSPTMP